MIISNNTPPSPLVPFSTIPDGDVFVFGAGNVPYQKRADGGATRLGDGVDSPFAPTDAVRHAPNATLDVFPSP